MSTFENPDAASGADALPTNPDASMPSLTDADETAVLADLEPPAPADADETVVLSHLEPAPADAETAVLADLEPPLPEATATPGLPASGTAPFADPAPSAPLAPPVPAALPPAYTGVEPALTAPAPERAAAAAPPTGPRVRWAGILWGLVLAGIAATGVWILTDASRQTALVEWMLGLSPAAAVAYAVLILGGFALVAGLVGLARRAQRVGERRRAASAHQL